MTKADQPTYFHKLHIKVQRAAYGLMSQSLATCDLWSYNKLNDDEGFVSITTLGWLSNSTTNFHNFFTKVDSSWDKVDDKSLHI